MRSRAGFILGIITIIFGVLLVLLASETICECPAQLVGQPNTCACATQLTNTLVIGVVAIALGAIITAFSMRKPKSTLPDRQEEINKEQS